MKHIWYDFIAFPVTSCDMNVFPCRMNRLDSRLGRRRKPVSQRWMMTVTEPKLLIGA
jgi:hypothetical protein